MALGHSPMLKNSASFPRGFSVTAAVKKAVPAQNAKAQTAHIVHAQAASEDQVQVAPAFSNMPQKIVSSHDEFSPLEHIVVGRANDCCIAPKEPACESKVPFDSPMRGLTGRRPEDTIVAANKQLDNLA